jgi:hypothetical protein
MDKIAKDFKDTGVVFYMLYTREPHAGQNMGKFDFSNKKQTTTMQERVDYALDMLKEYAQVRPVLIDAFGEKCLQQTIGGGMPNSLIVVDKEGKIALWQGWSDPVALRRKLEEMTGSRPAEAAPTAEKNDVGPKRKRLGPAKSER